MTPPKKLLERVCSGSNMTEANIRNRRPSAEEPLYDWVNDTGFWENTLYPEDLPLARYSSDEHLLFVAQKSYEMKVPPVVLNTLIRALHQPEEALDFFSRNYQVAFRNTVGRLDEQEIYDTVREQNRLDEGKENRRIVRRNFLSELIECLNMGYRLNWSDSRRDFLQGSLLVMLGHRGKFKIYIEEGFNRGTSQRRCASVNMFGQPTRFSAGEP